MTIFTDFRQALANLRAQKTRTLLTALGIVFGVGSVIGMLAIGAGAREESLRFIEQLGVRNVLVGKTIGKIFVFLSCPFQTLRFHSLQCREIGGEMFIDVPIHDGFRFFFAGFALPFEITRHGRLGNFFS